MANDQPGPGCALIAATLGGIVCVLAGVPQGWLMVALGGVGATIYFVIQHQKEQEAIATLRHDEEKLAQYKDGLRALFGKHRVVCLCTDHPKLIEPTVCAITFDDNAIQTVALRTKPEETTLEYLRDSGVDTLLSNLTIQMDFDDVLQITKRRPDTVTCIGMAPKTDDRLKRAVLGGVLAGGAGAVAGALSADPPPEDTGKITRGDHGGVFDRMTPNAETVIALRSGEHILVDGLDDACYSEFSSEYPWRGVVDDFLDLLRRVIADARLK